MGGCIFVWCGMDVGVGMCVGGCEDVTKQR